MKSTFLAASELVLNPDKSVYHLNLHNEDIADLVITVGDPDRVDRVSRHFDRIQVTKKKREFITHTGEIGATRITVCSTGIGPDNIDIMLNELDAAVNIDPETRQVRSKLRSLKIIRLGTSGSLQEDIPVNSLVVSDFGMGIDNLLSFYKFRRTRRIINLLGDFREYMIEQKVKLPVNPYLFEADPELRALFNGYTSGITVTCPGFYGPQGRQLRAENAIQGWVDHLHGFKSSDGVRITNFEMETSALFGLSKILGHKALSVNTILANRRTGEFSDKPYDSVDHLIENALAVLVGK